MANEACPQLQCKVGFCVPVRVVQTVQYEVCKHSVPPHQVSMCFLEAQTMTIKCPTVHIPDSKDILTAVIPSMFSEIKVRAL